MGARADKHPAAADIAFQPGRASVRDAKHPAGIPELFIQLPDGLSVVARGPNHMGDQGHGKVRVFQHMADQGAVIFHGNPRLFFVVHDHGADV